ncbi:hypothetical protein D917_05096 [Trichinella nativa]|uniref:Uncharacterized protein n=1 Tax=Trichinella nativa TaxID=6335 RepID=A0A1Y3F274_9BILA|nr:hypothetical protein D917_05096 [Trichinella nativa]
MGEIISPFDSCVADKERENFAIFEGEPKTFIASPPSKPPHSCTRRSFDCCTGTFSPKRYKNSCRSNK